MLVGGLALCVISIESPNTLVPAAILAMAVGWSWPGLFLFAVIRVGRDRGTSASGWLQAGAFAGGAAGPLAFGLVVDAAGYPLAWQLAGLALLTSSLLVVQARRDFIADLLARPPRESLG